MRIYNLILISLVFCAACSVKVQGKDEAPQSPKIVNSPKDQPLALSQPGATVWNHVVITDFSQETTDTAVFMFHVPEKTEGKLGLNSISYSGCLDAETNFQLVELQGTTISAAYPMSVWTQQSVSPQKSYAVLAGIKNFKTCKSLYVDFMVDHKN